MITAYRGMVHVTKDEIEALGDLGCIVKAAHIRLIEQGNDPFIAALKIIMYAAKGFTYKVKK